MYFSSGSEVMANFLFIYLFLYGLILRMAYSVGWKKKHIWNNGWKMKMGGRFVQYPAVFWCVNFGEIRGGEWLHCFVDGTKQRRRPQYRGWRRKVPKYVANCGGYNYGGGGGGGATAQALGERCKDMRLGETNRQTKGWDSTDRSVEAALLNTSPWPVTKSSASDREFPLLNLLVRQATTSDTFRPLNGRILGH